MKFNELTLVDNFNPGSEEATIRLNDKITDSDEEGISARRFNAEFDFLTSMGVKKIIVTINSPGGKILQGLEIYSTIQDAKIDTETRVVGIAGSIAGVISQSGKKRTIKKHAFFHAHSPRPEEGTEVSNTVMTIAFNSLKEIMKSNSKMTEDEVVNMLSKESFYPAQDAKDLGFFDEVLPSGQRFAEVEGAGSPEEVMNLVNELDSKSKNKSMSKINEILGLANEASEGSQLAEINALKAKASRVDELEQEITEKDSKIETLENDVKETAKKTAELMIENASKEGKIDITDEEVKTSWIENAISNPEGTKKMLDSMKSVVASAKIPVGNDKKKGSVENRKEWDFEKWSQEDPKELENMRNQSPDKFEELLNAYTEA